MAHHFTLRKHHQHCRPFTGVAVATTVVVATLLPVSGHAVAWTGPPTRIVAPRGFPLFDINGTLTSPLMLGLPLAGFMNASTAVEDATVVAEVKAAASAGVNLLLIRVPTLFFDPAFGRPLDIATRRALDMVIAANPAARFVLGASVALPTPHAAEQTVVSSAEKPGASTTVEFDSLTDAWLEQSTNWFRRSLLYLDECYPGRIAGVMPQSPGDAIHVHEWFLPGPLTRTVPDDSVCDYSEGMAVDWCRSEAAWQHIDKSAGTAREDIGNTSSACVPPTAVERNTATAGNFFLAWPATTSGNASAAARSVRFNEFMSTRVARAIAALAAVAKDVSGGALLTVAFYGYTVEIADVRMVNSGHLALRQLLESPHLDVVTSPYQYEAARVLGQPFTVHGPWDSLPIATSGTASPKLWMPQDDTRTSLGTHQQDGDHFRCCTSLRQTVGLLRRNMITAAMHQGGLWWYDLFRDGWFGNATDVEQTAQLWERLGTAHSTMMHLATGDRPYKSPHNNNSETPQSLPQSSASPLPSISARDSLLQTPTAVDRAAQILIFVDEVAALRRPVLGLRTANASVLNPLYADLVKNVPNTIASIGAPTRVHLLSDLWATNDVMDSVLAQVRCVVMLNAFVLTAQQRAIIAAKLQTAGRTIVWQYAPALLSADGPSNDSAPADVTTLPLRVSWNPPRALRSTIVEASVGSAPAGWTELAGTLYGAGPTVPPVSPWLESSSNTTDLIKIERDGSAADTKSGCGSGAECVSGTVPTDNATTTTLAVYTDTDIPSAVMARRTNHTAVWMGTPALPPAAWRAIAADAGVHMYVEMGDTVEVAGGAVMVHVGANVTGDVGATAARDAIPRSRTVTLPRIPSAVHTESGALVCGGALGLDSSSANIPCTISFETPPMEVGDTLLWWVDY